jgi:ferredoxin
VPTTVLTPSLTSSPSAALPSICRTRRSRLACQVKVTKELDGCVVYVPDGPRSDIP